MNSEEIKLIQPSVLSVQSYNLRQQLIELPDRIESGEISQAQVKKILESDRGEIPEVERAIEFYEENPIHCVGQEKEIQKELLVFLKERIRILERYVK